MNLTILHVGFGGKRLPAIFDGWREVTQDINPEMRPEICCSMTDMTALVKDDCFDLIYAAHCLEHLARHEAGTATSEFFRVLKDGGKVIIGVPDLEEVAKLICAGKIEECAYKAEIGEVTPLDMLYGHSTAIKTGNAYMMHRTGFTEDSLCNMLEKVGFKDVGRLTAGDQLELWVRGEK